MLWIDDNYFLTDHSPENVLLWNETANGKWNGNVLELKLHDGVYIHGLVRTNDEVLLVEFVGGFLLVHSLNTHNGSASHKWTFDIGEHEFDTDPTLRNSSRASGSYISNGEWLIITTFKTIYVCNTKNSTIRNVYHFIGGFHYVSDCLRTFFVDEIKNGRRLIHGLKLWDDGQLTWGLPFRVTGDTLTASSTHVITAPSAKTIVHDVIIRHVNIYNAKTGELERSIPAFRNTVFPPHAVISHSRQEILIIADGTLLAFCL